MSDAWGRPKNVVVSPEDDESLRNAIIKQVEWYFSKENLANDTYLVSQMNAEMFVAISTIASFKMIRHLTHDYNTLVDAMKNCPAVVVDENSTMVKPSFKPNRTVIVLNDIPNSIPAEEVRSIFDDQTKCAKVQDIRIEPVDTWVVTFDADDKQVSDTWDFIHQNTFRGHPIRGGLRVENVLRSLLLQHQQMAYAQQAAMTPYNYYYYQQQAWYANGGMPVNGQGYGYGWNGVGVDMTNNYRYNASSAPNNATNMSERGGAAGGRGGSYRGRGVGSTPAERGSRGRGRGAGGRGGAVGQPNSQGQTSPSQDAAYSAGSNAGLNSASGANAGSGAGQSQTSHPSNKTTKKRGGKAGGAAPGGSQRKEAASQPAVPPPNLGIAHFPPLSTSASKEDDSGSANGYGTQPFKKLDKDSMASVIAAAKPVSKPDSLKPLENHTAVAEQPATDLLITKPFPKKATLTAAEVARNAGAKPQPAAAPPKQEQSQKQQ